MASGGTWTGFYEDRFPSSTNVNNVTSGNSSNGNIGNIGNNSNYSYSYSSSYVPYTNVPNYNVPQLSYTQRTLDELLQEAQGLIGAQYDAQILAAEQGYKESQQTLAKSYDKARTSTQDSAVARGMGRSSYLTDSIANVGLQETAANKQLTDEYNATVSNLQQSKANAISSYVQSLQRQQEEMAYNLALQQAELQYKYDALNQAAQLAAWQQALSRASSSGGGGGSGSGSSGSTLNALKNMASSGGYGNTTSQAVASPTYNSGSSSKNGGWAPTKGKNYRVTR